MLDRLLRAGRAGGRDVQGALQLPRGHRRRVLQPPEQRLQRRRVYSEIGMILNSFALFDRCAHFVQGDAMRAFFSRTDEFGLALSDSHAAEIVAAICVTAKTCTLGQKCDTACCKSAEKLAVSDARCSRGCGRGVKSFSPSPLLPHTVLRCNPRVQVFFC